VSGGLRDAGLTEDPQDENSRGTNHYDGPRGEEKGNKNESAGYCSRDTDGPCSEVRIGFLSPAKREPEKRTQGSPITPTILPVRELRNRQAIKQKPKLVSEEVRRLAELERSNAAKVKKLLGRIGLVTVDNAGLGNCLFLTIARGLGWNPQSHKKLLLSTWRRTQMNSKGS
jgi:hypothetical protein